MARHIQFNHRQFVNALDSLIIVTAQAKACVKIVRELGALLGNNPEIKKLAPVFWEASGSALAEVAQLWTFKLFDPDSQLTVPSLLDQAAGLRTQFSDATPQEADAIVQMAKTKIALTPTDHREQIQSKRNKLIAHLDRRLILDRAKIEPDLIVTWSDINLELGIAESILTELSERFRGIKPVFDVPGADDYNRVVEAVMQFLD